MAEKRHTNSIQQTLENTARSSALLQERYDTYRTQLSRSELVIADYFIALPLDELIFRSAEQIAFETGTSDATVIRTARRLGFTGLPELKRLCSRAMATAAPTTERLAHRFKATGSEFKKVTGQIFTTAHEILSSTQEKLDAVELEKSVTILENADQVWCFGFGTSEVEAKHCAISLSRVGLRTRCSRTTGFALANELIDLRATDVVIVFHAASDLPELGALIKHARETGSHIILVCGMRLCEIHKADVSAVLASIGAASGLASWSLGAIVIGDILAYCIAVQHQQRALVSREKLARLRGNLVRPNKT
ncbi:MurR/RpiR family transcriptional regulator [Phyllobacterium sp. YR531]|uniref:MurR/RpiR family transcriptional regulator n=1 Tax=Phyllobacterium sp. YR531 TaxID=1144343 RepID=UPI00026F872B|nr:MurR/RpiR family transcriptional regulator [Phyllobacterium sp. YR531]EJN03599.1 transcriptional regulator [Phyllobacterium sp. YR531]